MASFGALWELILLQLNCLSRMPRVWLVKTATALLCVKKWGGRLHDCPSGLKSGGHVPLPICRYAPDSNGYAL